MSAVSFGMESPRRRAIFAAAPRRRSSRGNRNEKALGECGWNVPRSLISTSSCPFKPPPENACSICRVLPFRCQTKPPGRARHLDTPHSQGSLSGGTQGDSEVRASRCEKTQATVIAAIRAYSSSESTRDHVRLRKSIITVRRSSRAPSFSSNTWTFRGRLHSVTQRDILLTLCSRRTLCGFMTRLRTCTRFRARNLTSLNDLAIAHTDGIPVGGMECQTRD